jgi:hypothetical protein
MKQDQQSKQIAVDNEILERIDKDSRRCRALLPPRYTVRIDRAELDLLISELALLLKNRLVRDRWMNDARAIVNSRHGRLACCIKQRATRGTRVVLFAKPSNRLRALVMAIRAFKRKILPVFSQLHS